MLISNSGAATWRSLVGDLIGEFVVEGAERAQKEVAYESLEPRNAAESLRQFVGVVVDLRGRQVGRPEAADQQRQEQVQHLKTKKKKEKKIKRNAEASNCHQEMISHNLCSKKMIKNIPPRLGLSSSPREKSYGPC